MPLQPIGTLAEVSAKLAKKSVEAVCASLETDAEKLEPRTGDDSRVD